MNDETPKASIIARLQMWLIDEDYMRGVDVHDLITDALHEIEKLSSEQSDLLERLALEVSLADALALSTSGILGLVSNEAVESLGEFREKVNSVLYAWQLMRGQEDD